MSTPANPNVDDRSNTTFFTGPLDNGTQLTGVLFIDVDTLPTTDPGVAGQIYSDGGVLTVSVG